MHGACNRGGFRSGDVLITVAGLWGDVSSDRLDTRRALASPRHVQPVWGHVMSIHLATRNLFRSGLAAGALLTALGVANAQPTQLPSSSSFRRAWCRSKPRRPAPPS